MGERVWRALGHFSAVGAAVTGSGRLDTGAHGLEWAGGPDDLDRLCAESDVLIVGAPLTEQTRGSLGADQLAAVGPDGVLIQLARGPVADEEALFTALRDGRLGAAAIDVWYDYPPSPGVATAPSRFDFGALPNALMTPHVSGVAASTFEGRLRDVVANVEALAEGRPLRNIVR
ncbi:NAD(P)-dependent oxidoreductase [Mariniluteicoccus flavus]